MGTAYEPHVATEFKGRNSAFPQPFYVDGSAIPVESLMFDAGTDEASFVRLWLIGYASGNLTVTINWYADTASSGDVVWGCALAAITPDTDTQDVETKALATENTATDSHLGTTGQRMHKVNVTVSNLDSVADGDWIMLRVRRVGSSGSDTMTGDAGLLDILVTYTTA